MTTRTRVIVLLALAAAFFLTQAGSYQHFLRAESNFALGARMMIDTGEWLLPHAQHEGGLNRPPLQYWAIGVAYHVFGVGFGAARLPAALCALALIGLVCWVGARLFEPRVGLCAAAVLATSYIFWSFARLAMPDMLLTLAVSVALACWIVVLSDRTAFPGLFAAAGAVAVAFGVLCKGPIVVVLTALPIVMELAISGEWAALSRLAPIRGAIICAALSAPYFLAVWMRAGGEPLYRFFVGENVSRFVGGGWWHQDLFPPLYELGAFLVGFLPWSPLVAVTAWRCVRRKVYGRHAPRVERMMLLWAVTPILFFSLSRFKLDYYFLPGMPPMALLVAHGLVQGWTAWPQTRLARAALFGLVAAVAAAVMAATVPVVQANAGSAALPWLPHGAALLGLGAAAVWARGTDPYRTVLAGAAVIVVVTVSCYLSFLPRYGAERSAEAVAASVPAGATVVFVSEAHEWSWDVALFLGTSSPAQFASFEEGVRRARAGFEGDRPVVLVMYQDVYKAMGEGGVQTNVLSAFDVRRGDNLTWKSLRRPVRDVLYVVAPAVVIR